MAVKRNNDRTPPQATVGIHSAGWARGTHFFFGRLIAAHLFLPDLLEFGQSMRKTLEECSNGDQSCEQVAWMGQGVWREHWTTPCFALKLPFSRNYQCNSHQIETRNAIN